MNGALQQRLRFIDFLLAPVNADYVASNRRYERTRNFTRKWP